MSTWYGSSRETCLQLHGKICDISVPPIMSPTNGARAAEALAQDPPSSPAPSRLLIDPDFSPRLTEEDELSSHEHHRITSGICPQEGELELVWVQGVQSSARTPPRSGADDDASPVRRSPVRLFRSVVPTPEIVKVNRKTQEKSKLLDVGEEIPAPEPPEHAQKLIRNHLEARLLRIVFTTLATFLPFNIFHRLKSRIILEHYGREDGGTGVDGLHASFGKGVLDSSRFFYSEGEHRQARPGNKLLPTRKEPRSHNRTASRRTSRRTCLLFSYLCCFSLFLLVGSAVSFVFLSFYYTSKCEIDEVLTHLGNFHLYLEDEHGAETEENIKTTTGLLRYWNNWEGQHCWVKVYIKCVRTRESISITGHEKVGQIMSCNISITISSHVVLSIIFCIWYVPLHEASVEFFPGGARGLVFMRGQDALGQRATGGLQQYSRI